jgi:hypothetical protein
MRGQRNLKTLGQQIFGHAVAHQTRGPYKTDVFHAFLSCDESKNTHARCARVAHAKANMPVRKVGFKLSLSAVQGPAPEDTLETAGQMTHGFPQGC